MKADKTDNFTDYELKCAYEMCQLVRDNSANVLATLAKGEKSKADSEWLRKSTAFLKAYERVMAYRSAKEGNAGSMGKALLLMEGLSKSLDKLSKEV